MSLYTLASFPVLEVNDSPERLDYHIKSDDYLAFVATKLGFLEEAVIECSALSKEVQGLARELRHDLRYVQAHYKVVPRGGAEIQTMRPSGNLLGK